MTSAAIFAIVALAHLLRVANGWTVTVNAAAVPLWASWAAVVLATALAIWGLASTRR